MKATITLIISTVILFIILVAMWLPFDTVVTQMNDTVTDANYLEASDKTTITDFYTTLRTLFSMLFAISLAGIPLAYLFDAHRQEHEQFQEYERWK
jgi:ABC-type spermidine/putrescine transport system permease subunit I